MMNCVFVIEGISQWVINWLMNANWLYDALISSDKPVLLLLCLISSREIKFIVPLMADEVKPSVCSAGLSLKWSSLRTSHSRGGRLRKDIAVTCFSNQVKKKAKKKSICVDSTVVDMQCTVDYINLYIFWFLIHRFPAMGNSASTGFITPTPRKLSWGRKREDTVKLEDLLTQCEEDLWRVKAKQSLPVKKVHLTRSVRYVNLAAQQSDSCFPHSGETLNPAFVGDQGPWGTEFTVDN